MKKTNKNNIYVTCDTLYTIQTSKNVLLYTDNMKKTMTKDNIMTKEQKQQELNELMKIFFKKGNKIEKFPAQKSQIKHICRTRTSYSSGRIRWQHKFQKEVLSKVA